MELTLQCKVQYLNDIDPFDVKSTVPEPVRAPSHVFLTNVPLCYQLETLKRLLQAPHKVEDCALQLTKFSGGQLEFLSYLDLEQTLVDQQEELEEFRSNKRNVLILRTQLPVRVQCCLEKLSNAAPNELKKHLYALKQVLQDDKDFVHEFVNTNGLDCLIRISERTESNSVYHVLKVLGQLMLYVDGMNGVIGHQRTIQWLYAFIGSQIRLVVKMALKLLLVFVEYNDTNWQLMTQAVAAEDMTRGERPWSSVVKLMKDADLADVEVLTYTMTLINKILSAVPDRDTFYDITDSLEEQGLDGVMKSLGGETRSAEERRELLEQFEVYESLVSFEDGDGVSPQSLTSSSSSSLLGFKRIHKVRSSEDIKRTRRKSADVSIDVSRKISTSQVHLNLVSKRGSHNGFANNDVARSTPSIPELLVEENTLNKKEEEQEEEEKAGTEKEHFSKSFSDMRRANDNSISSVNETTTPNNDDEKTLENDDDHDDDDKLSSSSSKSQKEFVSTCLPTITLSTSQTGRQSMSRRQRRQRQQSQIDEMASQFSSPSTAAKRLNHDKDDDNESTENSEPPRVKTEADDVFPNHEKADVRVVSSSISSGAGVLDPLERILNVISNVPSGGGAVDTSELVASVANAVVTLDAKPHGPPAIQKCQSMDEAKSVDDFASKVCAAKSQLKSTKLPLKKLDSSPVSSSSSSSTPLVKFCESLARPWKLANSKKDAEPEQQQQQQQDDAIQWPKLERESLKLPLRIKEADFSDLTEADDQDVLLQFRGRPDVPRAPAVLGSSVDPRSAPPPPPPPPPPLLFHPPPPPPLSSNVTALNCVAPPPAPPVPPSLDGLKGETLQRKKTKLHWREANSHFAMRDGKVGTIWEELRREIGKVSIDRVKFEALFETKTQDIKTKEKIESTKKKLSILDQKRSNAINIGMVHLPKAGTIKNAILSMDNSVLSREDIEKILVGMMPTEEEKSKILEAQRTNDANSDLQLGTAEQFLLTMGSISELESRLRLWIFKMDYDSIESEICDPLHDLKRGMEELKGCRTFKFILSSLLSIGNFLNNSQVPGFTLDYLVKVTEVKDNVYRHTLLHHLVNVILETFPNSSDLYSEIGSIIRCAKVDWDDLKEKLAKLESDCNSSVEYLKSIVKHDSTFQSKHRMREILTDFAKRIVLVKIVYRRVINRFKKFLLWLGYSEEEARTVTVNQLCQAIGEFALEYRTTREKVINIRLKKANMKERKKTRGVMIVQTRKFASKAKKLPTLGEDGGGDLEMLLQNEASFASNKNRSRRSLDPKSFQRSLSNFKPTVRDSDRRTESEEMKSSGTKEADPGTNTPVSSDSPDDDLLEAVLRSVTSTSEPKTRERRRARNVERKSLRRTLKSGLSIEEVAVIEKYG